MCLAVVRIGSYLGQLYYMHIITKANKLGAKDKAFMKTDMWELPSGQANKLNEARLTHRILRIFPACLLHTFPKDIENKKGREGEGERRSSQ